METNRRSVLMVIVAFLCVPMRLFGWYPRARFGKGPEIGNLPLRLLNGDEFMGAWKEAYMPDSPKSFGRRREGFCWVAKEDAIAVLDPETFVPFKRWGKFKLAETKIHKTGVTVLLIDPKHCGTHKWCLEATQAYDIGGSFKREKHMSNQEYVVDFEISISDNKADHDEAGRGFWK